MSNSLIKKVDIDLVLKQDSTIHSLVHTMPEHENMLVTIADNLPEIKRASSLFGKSQSQFMDNMMTVSHFTPLRNARQTQAQIEDRRKALAHAHFTHEKKKVKQRKKIAQLETEKDEFKQQLLQIEIDEIGFELEESRKYISGAIRQMTNYIEQYNSILKHAGKENFSEQDFEQEEEAYHIAKAFTQAISAARSRPGDLIDEGNHIYFEQIGINGAVAQQYVSDLFRAERVLLSEDKQPDSNLQKNFIETMIKHFSGCSIAMAKARGMLYNTESSMLKNGDNSLK